MADAVEVRAKRLAQAMRRPRNMALAVSLLIVLAVLVRLPAVTDEQAWFTNHADEATYFNQAAGVYIVDGRERTPLEHGGSGLPLLLEATFRATGVEPVGHPIVWSHEVQVDQFHDHGADPLDSDQRRAAAIAYGLNAMLGAGTVVAAWWVARQLFGPLASLAAAGFVAFDPFQVSLDAQLMSETAFTLCIMAALGCALWARARPSRLWVTAPLLAGAHFLRATGLVMMVMVLAFAAIVLHDLHRRRAPAPDDGGPAGPSGGDATKPRLRDRLRAPGRTPLWRHVAIAFVAFWVLSAPYLEWRDEHLPSGFDYGTNSRLFADAYWDFDDAYWHNSSYGDRGPKESLGDYFATHDAGDAVARAWNSFSWSVDDILFGTAWHDGKRGHGDTAVLHPILVVGAVAAGATVWRARTLWMVPMAFVFAYAPVAWTYAIHDSPRYYALAVPLVAVVAVLGIWRLARRTPWPHALAAGVFGLFLAMYAAAPLLEGLRAVPGLFEYAGLPGLVFTLGLAWVVLATRRDWARWWRGQA